MKLVKFWEQIRDYPWLLRVVTDIEEKLLDLQKDIPLFDDPNYIYHLLSAILPDSIGDIKYLAFRPAEKLDLSAGPSYRNLVRDGQQRWDVHQYVTFDLWWHVTDEQLLSRRLRLATGKGYSSVATSVEEAMERIKSLVGPSPILDVISRRVSCFWVMTDDDLSGHCLTYDIYVLNSELI